MALFCKATWYRGMVPITALNVNIDIVYRHGRVLRLTVCLHLQIATSDIDIVLAVSKTRMGRTSLISRFDILLNGKDLMNQLSGLNELTRNGGSCVKNL